MSKMIFVAKVTSIAGNLAVYLQSRWQKDQLTDEQAFNLITASLLMKMNECSITRQQGKMVRLQRGMAI
jgi:hypothetical protein